MNNRTDLALTVPSEAFLPFADIEARPGLGRLPDEPRIFEGREDELLAITRAFEEGAVIQALWGLGGVGKTTLASQWAVNHTAEYHPVWWIDGSSAESITAGLADIAHELRDVVAKWLSPEALRERAKEWLLTHRDWLLVLDNVNNPDDVRFLKAIARNRGRVLITTRLAAGWHDIGTAVPVRLLSEAAAVQLFTRIYEEKGPQDTSGVEELCAELGYLALAIQQAAAYCVLEEGMTAQLYLDKMAEAPDVMQQAPYEGRQLERTMAGVWEPSLDRLGDTPFAADVLRTLAWIPAHDPAFPTTRVPRAALESLGPRPAVLKALGRLAAHSLIGLDQEYVYVHRVVQSVVRTSRADSPHRSPELIRAAHERAAPVIAWTFPNDIGRPTTGGTR
ncbi:NB-ARC domain-containing protein [Streptomyces cylindrosporus]|uniref:NB-ARC domain-containing protein n=1 Tax=Streptomyces cylindrosporus TaxID=2927583 RepID=A0ABS9Y9A7_9ACTN|nr:NB-ARC domain-containing protein [Streptomyces cylindrosporus]MCI3273815.1 NB-ARC domain-containing protein [Streptomyces cylindrosporus]